MMAWRRGHSEAVQHQVGEIARIFAEHNAPSINRDLIGVTLWAHDLNHYEIDFVAVDGQKKRFLVPVDPDPDVLAPIFLAEFVERTPDGHSAS